MTAPTTMLEYAIRALDSVLTDACRMAYEIRVEADACLDLDRANRDRRMTNTQDEVEKITGAVVIARAALVDAQHHFSSLRSRAKRLRDARDAELEAKIQAACDATRGEP